jgi:hypothetical protein
MWCSVRSVHLAIAPRQRLRGVRPLHEVRRIGGNEGNPTTDPLAAMDREGEVRWR